MYSVPLASAASVGWAMPISVTRAIASVSNFFIFASLCPLATKPQPYGSSLNHHFLAHPRQDGREYRFWLEASQFATGGEGRVAPPHRPPGFPGLNETAEGFH